MRHFELICAFVGLLDEKGIERGQGAATSAEEKKPDPLEEKTNKPSLAEKIKSKIRKGSS